MATIKSIEEKAKAYDEAKERMKDFLKEWEDCGAVGEAMEKARNIFPELKESEDERIRKALIEYFRWVVPQILSGFDNKEVLAWLEKQGEQKSAVETKTPEKSLGIDSDTYNKIVDDCIYGEQKPSWSEEDETGLTNTIIMLKEGASLHFNKRDITKAVDWLKALKDRVLPHPKQEWSEEDERIIDRLCEIIYDCHSYGKCGLKLDEYSNLFNWLKSLRPQSYWKPSDEQMNILNEVLNFTANHKSPHWNDYIFGTLNNLIRQLKKLREEQL